MDELSLLAKEADVESLAIDAVDPSKVNLSIVVVSVGISVVC